MSEIDDIFAGKGAAPLPAASSVPKKKKKSKKRRRDESQSTPSASSSKVVPVTVVDSSSLPLPPPKRLKKVKVKKSAAPEAVSKTEDNFADSRGSSSRRTTEEGWSIYKEDELGMSKEGGDTPLCPFDCDCCF